MEENKKVTSVGAKQIREAIVSRTLTIKRKVELFNEAKKINEELKQLNEIQLMGRGTGLGPGFKNRTDVQGNIRDSKEGVIGLAGRHATGEDKEFGNTDGKPRTFTFEELYGLEEEMKDMGEESSGSDAEGNILEKLTQENKELKEKLNKIAESINEIKK